MTAQVSDNSQLDDNEQPSVHMIQVMDLGIQDYTTTWQSMMQFTEQREPETIDQIWLVEHPPVYTMGLAAKQEHLLNPGDIAVVDTDRGGQVTYHGPGQIVAYLLLDLKRRELGIKGLVRLIEQAIIDLLADYKINAHLVDGAPGVYVDNSKIAALGLRVKRNGCYHGLSLNVDMDLTPFQGINPCGYPGLDVIQLKDLDQQLNADNMYNIQQNLVSHLLKNLNSVLMYELNE